MPRKKKEQDAEILEKLEYIGLNLDKIPENLKKFKPLQFVFPKNSNEKQQYKQYKFIPVKDIQILLSPTNRLDDLKEKYRKAMPLSEYLDSKSEENALRYITFLDMLRKVKIEDIQKIELEQEKLSKQLPFKVKFEGNYLWQIYYSEVTDKYFMLVPTKDSNYSTFFYLLKKKLEKSKTSKIFVPVMGVNYSKNFYSGAEIEDIENFLWVLTHDWPMIYEVFDKQDNISMQILGETAVFDNIKSQYKIKLNTGTEAKRLYKLLKAMFILQTELPNYFEFKTKISEDGELEFYLDEEKIEYTKLAKFVKNQFAKGEKRKVAISERIIKDSSRLENLKQEGSLLDIEFIEKEKQISTFLECKKTFFGKFKYYFKYSKKNKKTKIKKDNFQEKKSKSIKVKEEMYKAKDLKDKYTIEELIESYKELEELDVKLKNIIMDINAVKLKNKNMKKKIENASAYIQEIDSHKKSIFEFWKYSNKDEMSSLPEGEEEEINIEKKPKKEFDYKEDIELLGKSLDKIQLKNLSKEERESIFIATTNLIDILNKVKLNEVMPKEIEASLKELKKQQKEFEILENMDDDENEIFIKNIKEELKSEENKQNMRDKFKILEIEKGTKQIRL